MGEVRRIAKPFFPWVGGKLFLLPYIFQLLPRRAPRLLEVCGGSGAGMNLSPVAFLIVKGDSVRLMPVAPPPGTAVDRVVEMVPDVIDKVTGFIEKQQDKDKSQG